MKFSSILRALHSTTTTTRCCLSNKRARNVRFSTDNVEPVCALINEILFRKRGERKKERKGESRSGI